MEEEKRGPGRPKKEQMVQCVVNRDFWPAEGERVRKGTIVEMTAAEALDGIESGAMSRLKTGAQG